MSGVAKLVRWVAAAIVLLVVAGCESTTTDTTLPDPLGVETARQLPDGTHVERLEGWIVVNDGQPQLVDQILGIFPPAPDTALDLHGIDVDVLDVFHYPQSDLAWADRYLVSGTMLDGGLVVDAIRFLEIEPDRRVAEACESAVANGGNLGQCPEPWLSHYLEDESR